MSEAVTFLPASLDEWAPVTGQPSVAVLMSGGVDSSVTAHLLKRMGWNVVGITMKIPGATQTCGPKACCGAEAAVVCHRLGIAHYFIDVVDAFRKHVIAPFVDDYTHARTPSPCFECNARLKFDLVWRAITERFGIENVATGHYARVSNSVLRTAVDSKKDQSYFLAEITAERLTRLRLPLGTMMKSEVRQIAADAGMSVADRPESMELCFAGEGDYRRAFDEAKCVPGDILDVNGRVIGRHHGVFAYTIGQRKGLRIAGKEPLYVAAISLDANTVTLGPRERLMTRTVRARRPNVLLPGDATRGTTLRGKIRSAGQAAACRIVEVDRQQIHVEFDEPQFAPTAGQRLVLYNADEAVVAAGVMV